MYDVIVVGAGHNGLTCAAYLARAGKKVLVLEARDVVGGLAWTMEMPNAPGYRVNPCSVEFLLTGVQPSVDRELELQKYGLRWVYPDTLLTWLGPDGQVMPIWKDRNRLVEEISRYSHKDARRYGQLCDEITTTLKVALPYLQGHPTRVRPAALAQMLTKAAKGRKEIARGARAMLSSIEQVCEEYFDRDEIKVPVATYSLPASPRPGNPAPVCTCRLSRAYMNGECAIPSAVPAPSLKPWRAAWRRTAAPSTPTPGSPRSSPPRAARGGSPSTTAEPSPPPKWWPQRTPSR